MIVIRRSGARNKELVRRKSSSGSIVRNSAGRNFKC